MMFLIVRTDLSMATSGAVESVCGPWKAYPQSQRRAPSGLMSEHFGHFIVCLSIVNDKRVHGLLLTDPGSIGELTGRLPHDFHVR